MPTNIIQLNLFMAGVMPSAKMDWIAPATWAIEDLIISSSLRVKSLRT